MFEKYMIYDKGFQNIEKDGNIIGFQVGVRITYYRGVVLAVIGDFKVTVDGSFYTKEQMTFTVNGNTYTFDEMLGKTDEHWDFGDVAYLRVLLPGGLSEGGHSVEVTERIRVVYGLSDMLMPNIATWKKELFLEETYKLPPEIRRGVSLYSYQQEYYLKEMNLEDCIKAVADLGADGIEIISEAMIPGFPNPPQTWVDQWFALMDKYHTVPICYDAFMDGQIYEGKFITDEEAVEVMERDIKLAARLGFKYMRVLCAVPLRIIEKSLSTAEKYNVVMGIEVHSPFKLATPWLDEYVDFIKKTGTKYFGIIPDFGIFVEKPVCILERKHIRRGATPEIVAFISQCYTERRSAEETMEKVKTMDPNEEDLFWAKEAFTYTYCEPELLSLYIPYIIHIHGKMYEMEDGNEVSIPYDRIIKVLKDNHWTGYINTEYEGQRHYHDIEEWDVNSVEQVKLHHEMMKKYIGEE
ncbi:MAG: DUF6379 domain-containing protein [Anaerocolumna sp.]